MSVSSIDYRGTDKSGQGRTGRIDVPDTTIWVADRYRAGWKTLSLWADTHLVGGIGPDPASGGAKTVDRA